MNGSGEEEEKDFVNKKEEGKSQKSLWSGAGRGQ